MWLPTRRRGRGEGQAVTTAATIQGGLGPRSNGFDGWIISLWRPRQCLCHRFCCLRTADSVARMPLVLALTVFLCIIPRIFRDFFFCFFFCLFIHFLLFASRQKVMLRTLHLPGLYTCTLLTFGSGSECASR